MKPLQLLTTIPFWARSRRLGRIILTWVLGTLTAPLHTVSQTQLLWHGRDNKETDNASHPLGFSQFPVACSPPGSSARCPRAAGRCPQQGEPQGLGSGQAEPSLPAARGCSSLSTSPGLHGFTSLQKHNSQTSLFERVSQPHCKLWYNVCCAAHKGESTGSD